MPYKQLLSQQSYATAGDCDVPKLGSYGWQRQKDMDPGGRRILPVQAVHTTLATAVCPSRNRPGCCVTMCPWRAHENLLQRKPMHGIGVPWQGLSASLAREQFPCRVDHLVCMGCGISANFCSCFMRSFVVTCLFIMRSHEPVSSACWVNRSSICFGLGMSGWKRSSKSLLASHCTSGTN